MLFSLNGELVEEGEHYSYSGEQLCSAPYPENTPCSPSLARMKGHFLADPWMMLRSPVPAGCGSRFQSAAERSELEQQHHLLSLARHRGGGGSDTASGLDKPSANAAKAVLSASRVPCPWHSLGNPRLEVVTKRGISAAC